MNIDMLKNQHGVVHILLFLHSQWIQRGGEGDIRVFRKHSRPKRCSTGLSDLRVEMSLR
jgi:hypothetical protein